MHTTASFGLKQNGCSKGCQLLPTFLASDLVGSYVLSYFSPRFQIGESCTKLDSAMISSNVRRLKVTSTCIFTLGDVDAEPGPPLIRLMFERFYNIWLPTARFILCPSLFTGIFCLLVHDAPGAGRAISRYSFGRHGNHLSRIHPFYCRTSLPCSHVMASHVHDAYYMGVDHVASHQPTR